jgi:hypothetical protein
MERDPLSLELLEELRRWEKKRSEWLKRDEEEWHIKSRALWMKAGDNNTKFCHNFSR